jgi:glutamate synthase (NADPH/NADH) small chain
MEEAQTLGKGEQDFSIVTTRFEADGGKVEKLHYAQAASAPPFGPVEGTEGALHADLVLLAMGFLHPEGELLDQFGVVKDERGNAKASTYETSASGVFAAGDCRRGQSLIVWAINEGRQAARMCNRFLGRLDDDARSGNVEPQLNGRQAGPPEHASGAVSVE